MTLKPVNWLTTPPINGTVSDSPLSCLIQMSHLLELELHLRSSIMFNICLPLYPKYKSHFKIPFAPFLFLHGVCDNWALLIVLSLCPKYVFIYCSSEVMGHMLWRLWILVNDSKKCCFHLLVHFSRQLICTDSNGKHLQRQLKSNFTLFSLIRLLAFCPSNQDSESARDLGRKWHGVWESVDTPIPLLCFHSLPPSGLHPSFLPSSFSI